MELKYFKIEKSNKIARVVLSRADKSNALNHEAWLELARAFDLLSGDKSIHVILLYGEGRHFCAGMDLSTLMSIPSRFDSDCEAQKRKEIKNFIKEIQECISRIEACTIPVIACVHGACIGGALSILTACDMAYCSSDSYFSIKEGALGIVPDIGVLQRIPYWIGQSAMAELTYTARNFSAHEAHSMGLVSKLYDTKEEMLESIGHTAGIIAEKSRLVLEGIKSVMAYKRSHSIQDSLDYVSAWNAAFLLSNDLGEAMMKYMASRQKS